MANRYARTAMALIGSGLVITTALTLLDRSADESVVRNRGTSTALPAHTSSTAAQTRPRRTSAGSRSTPADRPDLTAVSAPAAVMQQRTFTIDEGAVMNPERGFFEGFTSPVTTAQLSQVRRDGFTLAHLDIDLGAYRGAPLSGSLLAAVGQDFAAARIAGVKLIPRFAYDFTAAGNDAPLPVVLGHIQQLAPLLRADVDVIAYLDAGFIGAWGEWHNSSNGLITHVIGGFEQVNPATRSIVSALLAALPTDRSILIRTQRYKYALFGSGNLTPGAAYSSAAAARVGFHNDCFLADSSDMGSYLVRATDEAWLARETEYVPLSGETCADDAAAQPYIQCPTALNELARLHWNSLNTGWFTGVIQTWKAQGCWWQISQRLGYRLALTSAQAPNLVTAGGSLHLRLTIRNSGFAAIHSARPVELVLRSAATGTQRSISVPADPRTWLPGRSSTVDTTVTIPVGLAVGRYDLLLALPDPAPALAGRPEYAVRFADQGTWDGQTGANALGLAVTVR